MVDYIKLETIDLKPVIVFSSEAGVAYKLSGFSFLQMVKKNKRGREVWYIFTSG